MGKKAHYKSLIFREFYFLRHLSCSEISNRIGKSLPFTMKILGELMDEGYVKESGFAPSSGGRRPAIYSLLPDACYIVCVAMDQLITRIGIMDVENKIVGEIEKFELPLQNNPSALSVLAEKMDEVIEKSGVNKEKIIGAGVGMPGFIDTKKGINYTFLECKEGSITQYLSDKLKIPVYIDNDSSIIALAEFRFGAARGCRNVMVINLGWGVGLGMILNGQLFRGNNGFAGEFSHIPLFDNGKLCSCGKTGCLESESSLLVVIEKVASKLEEGRLSVLNRNFPTGHVEQDINAIITAALKGDRLVVELLSEVGYNIGRGVAILIHLVNPEQIIISGRGAQAGQVWKAPIQQALNEHCIPRLAANTAIGISTLGYDAELIGAAALVMEAMGKDNWISPKAKYNMKIIG